MSLSTSNLGGEKETVQANHLNDVVLRAGAREVELSIRVTELPESRSGDVCIRRNDESE